MNILFLSPYPPYPPRSGGALRIYNLLLGVAARHRVTLLTFAPDEAAVPALDPLRAHCHVETVIGPPPRSLAQRTRTTLTSPLPDMAHRNASAAYSAALRQLLRRERFDIVQVESIEMARYGIADCRLQIANWPAPKIILDEFNAEYVLQKRAALTPLVFTNLKSPIANLYSLVQWQKLAAYERRLLKRCDHVLAVSDEDRRALHRLAPHAPISIVPNGVDSEYFKNQEPRTKNQRVATQYAVRSTQYVTLVFTGTLDFRPNVDAVTWFAHQVLPLILQRRPEARFVVVGRTPAPAVRALHNGSTIEVVPDVPDVRPYIAGAAAYLVPMRMGGGVRLKLLEALAMEAPIVSTSMGAEGVQGLTHGAQLLLADTPATFAAAVELLLAQPTFGQRLGAAGRAFVAAHYDWRAIVPRLEEVYRDLTM